MINEQLNWGVLGAARIATNQMIPAIQQSDTGRVAAIASRSAAKASDVAEHFGIDRSYGSYDDLLADPDIDVIYNPLPNSMHLEWSVKSAKAGKHILCEKPLGATADECRQMIDAAAQNNVLLIEAFWYRYHPKNLMIKEMVDDGSLGTLRAVRAYHYGTETRPTTSIAMSSELAGGALLFGGCYPVNLSRWLFGREPKTVSAIFEFDPLYKVDVTFTQIHHLTCGGGFFGTYNMCTGSSPRQSGVIDRPPVDDCVGVGGVVKPIWVVLRLRSKTPQGEMAWLGLGDLAESPSSDD